MVLIKRRDRIVIIIPLLRICEFPGSEMR